MSAAKGVQFLPLSVNGRAILFSRTEEGGGATGASSSDRGLIQDSNGKGIVKALKPHKRAFLASTGATAGGGAP
jgi:hypothetical protein